MTMMIVARAAAMLAAVLGSGAVEALQTVQAPDQFLSFSGATASGQFDVSPFLNVNGRTYTITSGRIDVLFKSSQTVSSIFDGPSIYNYVGQYTLETTSGTLSFSEYNLIQSVFHVDGVQDWFYVKSGMNEMQGLMPEAAEYTYGPYYTYSYLDDINFDPAWQINRYESQIFRGYYGQRSLSLDLTANQLNDLNSTGQLPYELGSIYGQVYTEGVSFSFARTPTGIPEPATWAMLLIGFGFVGQAVRRRLSETVPTAAD